jgi:hypothetical protein
MTAVHARHSLRRTLITLAGAVVFVLLAAPPAAAEHPRPHSGEVRARAATPPSVVFGIHPGGGAGMVHGQGTPRPEDPALRQAALDQLRPSSGRPFVVHLFDEFTSRADSVEFPDWLRAQIDDYTARGLHVELVLRYRPTRRRGDVRGFIEFVHRRVAQIGANRGVTHLQIANEANVPGAPGAADGAYRGARIALVRGVVAADRQARRDGRRHLSIGFNWAYGKGRREAAFFRSLRRHGGRPFARAVDWVGINAYPGTWGPTLTGGALDRAARAATIDAMRTLRRRHLPRTGLGHAALVFAESGYPTDLATRDQEQQRVVMTAVVRAVVQYRTTYRVHGLRWFKLRDADSSAPGFENHYGLMRDDYTPKASFLTFRDLVERHG